MRWCWRCLGAAAAIVPIAGLLIAWLGLIPVGASSGHWAVTEWFLHWTMRSSVRTAALSVGKPGGIEDVGDLGVAAAHFEEGCAGCHGSPAKRRSAEALSMLPPPPDLMDTIGSWTDEELFVIVRDGLRYTGMPAWPGRGREGEVWAMVNFLRKLPRMDGARYRQLSGVGNTSAGSVFPSCSSCHRHVLHDGAETAPVIAGQSEDYLIRALNAYVSGSRESGYMEVAASKIEASQIKAVAHHFANLPGLSAGSTAPIVDDRVRSLVETGDPVKKIAGCNACHDGRNSSYPVLSGQSRSYLREQLVLFKYDRRGESPSERLMSQAVQNLSNDDVERLAAHYAAVTPAAAAQ